MKTLIAQGAEAKLYLDGNRIIKDRIRKSYRISEIDEKLRSSRTRREEKILSKLAAINFPAPKSIECDGKEILVMEAVKGPKLRDILEKDDYSKLCRELGEKIAVMHNNAMIHGDLTTSNMLLEEKTRKIFFIDFGLSFFSHKVEDMAVDLHLLKQALESKHFKFWGNFFD